MHETLAELNQDQCIKDQYRIELNEVPNKIKTNNQPNFHIYSTEFSEKNSSQPRQPPLF